MCGRYAFDDIKDIFEARSIIEDIASRLGEDTAQSVKTGEVFPGDSAAVLAQRKGGCEAGIMSWGFPKAQSKQLIINARSETVFNINIFRQSVPERKCLIPCTGFYEWKSDGKRKIKHIIRPQGESFFYLAGLYGYFFTAGEKRNRFVILTAAANAQMQEIHHRMPLIVPKEYAERWLLSDMTPESVKRIYELTSALDIETA
jgi:putative SOS response-associated peptidase YedK